MKLHELTWYPYCVPFCQPFITAHGKLTHRRGALICIHLEDGSMGKGEIAPLPEFGGASLEEILQMLPALAEALRGRAIADVQQFFVTHNDQFPASLGWGMETALFDALASSSGQSITSLLGSQEEPGKALPVNAVISGETVDSVVEKALAALAAGFSCFKLKVARASQETVVQVAAVRAAIGRTPHLRLDANAGWNFAQARSMLDQCAVYDIEYIEQPLPAHEIENMARLRHVAAIPIAADEALQSLESARCILTLQAADVLILKPQMLGGPLVCRRIIQEAQQQQVRSVITSTLDTGIGVAAALHLAAASPEITLACGLATLDLLENDLLQEDLTIRIGEMALPTGPGLGVNIDWPALQKYALRDTF